MSIQSKKKFSFSNLKIELKCLADGECVFFTNKSINKNPKANGEIILAIKR